MKQVHGQKNEWTVSEKRSVDDRVKNTLLWTLNSKWGPRWRLASILRRAVPGAFTGKREQFPPPRTLRLPCTKILEHRQSRQETAVPTVGAQLDLRYDSERAPCPSVGRREGAHLECPNFPALSFLPSPQP